MYSINVYENWDYIDERTAIVNIFLLTLNYHISNFLSSLCSWSTLKPKYRINDRITGVV